jgi:hypothetical protein
MPRILMDMVKNIVVSQDDFTLAGEMISRDGLVRAAADGRADVVVLRALATTEAGEYRDLLYSRPRMKIIVIAEDGRDAVLHELEPHLIPLADVAPASLIAAIRSAAHSDGCGLEDDV